ncbi:MAG: hypothetical protein KC425_25885, partial [Anaerolineales bacterium]|nr:hypothetical protein [Anaerolineales bacterium]
MRLDDADLRRRLEAARLDALSAADLRARFVADADVAANAPAGQQARDPRDGTVILYNEVRARRPHDNRPAEAAARAERPCAICAGQTTGIVDVAPLDEGFTFINKNLYPALFPHAAAADGVASGLHFLQWSSTVHDHDWHNLPQADRVTLLRRLAALERVLLQDGAAEAGAAPWPDGRPLRGYLGIFKNYGYLVGGSLAHGHQQMV